MSRPSLEKTSVIMDENRKIDTGDEQLENVDNRLQELVKECGPFYKNPNLLKLYLFIIPGCLMAAVTLGFDSAMLNGLQAVPAWLKCTYLSESASCYCSSLHEY